MWQPLPFVMFLLIAAGVARRDYSRAGTAAILLIDWAACSTIVWLCADSYPWLSFLVFDYVAGLAIFAIRTSRWQSVVMLIYACEMVWHAAYGLSDRGVVATWYSYWALLYMAWAQVALVGGWTVHDAVLRWSSVNRGEQNRQVGAS